MGNLFANNPFMQLFKMVQTAKNPNAAMESAIKSNPQLGEVMDFIKKNGGNARELYYRQCQQNNVDPNMIINSLKSQM